MPNDNPEEKISQPDNNPESKKVNKPEVYSDFLQDMVDNSPEIQQHVVDAEAAKTATGNNQPVPPSNEPEKFNPEIHVVDKNGKPSVTKTGKFRKKKNIVNPFDKSPQQQEFDANIADSQASAELAQGLKRAVYDGVFDYKYDDSRHKIHVEATTKYFVSAGGVKLSPLQGLMILEGFMALELMRTEKATKKITGIKAWFASKWVKISDRRKNRNHGTQSNNRTEFERKNYFGEKDTKTEKGDNTTPDIGS